MSQGISHRISPLAREDILISLTINRVEVSFHLGRVDRSKQ